MQTEAGNRRAHIIAIEGEFARQESRQKQRSQGPAYIIALPHHHLEARPFSWPNLPS